MCWKSELSFVQMSERVKSIILLGQSIFYGSQYILFLLLGLSFYFILQCLVFMSLS